MSKAEETRARILGATRRLLEEDPRPVSMGEIARAAGVTRQLLYVHFDSRADLLLKLARAVDAEVRTADLQARIDGATDGATALRELVTVQGEIKPRIHAIATAMDRLRATDADAATAWEEREQARYRRTHAVIRRLADEGKLADVWQVTPAARLAWSVTSQRAWTELVVEAGWTTPTWVRHTTTVLHRALLTPPDHVPHR